MKLKLNFLFILFMLFFITFLSINSTYAVNDLRCCYEENSGGSIFAQSSCDQNSIDLGVVSYNYGNDLCKDYTDKKVGYQFNDICYKTFDNKLIFDIPEILSSFGSNFDSSKIVSLTSSTCLDNLPSDISTDLGTSTNSGSSGSSSSGGNDIGDINNQITSEHTTISQEQIQTCKDAGNPLGFFISKNACNNFESFGIKTCIYSPYLAGSFSTKFLNDDSNNLNFNSIEKGCIPKLLIKSCDQLITEDSCQNFDNLNCIWKNSNLYSDNNFERKTGICISNNSISKNKYFNTNEFYNRLNIIKNPSFEKGALNWIGVSSSNILLGNTVSANHFLELNENYQLSQNLSFIRSDLSYSPSIYLKTPLNKVNGSIILSLKVYDNSNNLKDNIYATQNIQISQINGNYNGGYFTKVNFAKFVSNSNISKITFELKISDRTTPIDIDAVSFLVDSSSDININSNLFSPVEIIPSSASSCNLCFENKKLNFCTAKKSNLLGDCSYMVNNSGEAYSFNSNLYSGKSSNIYMSSSNNTNWKSQSLTNSKLFCELYISKQSCTNPNNYVNSKFSSFHNLNGENLCKWDDSFGCFKDSNNDSLSDVRSGNIDYFGVNRTNFANLVYDYSNDFKYACDILPPSSNIYIHGKNSSFDTIFVTDNYSSLLGATYINIKAEDLILESCKNFDIQNSLTVNYKINNHYGLRNKVNSNILTDSLKLKDYFVYSNGTTMLKNGENNISLWVTDQSGNFGYEKKFKVNLDISPPTINITNFNLINRGENYYQFNETILPNKNISFNFKDFSAVSSCAYTLSGKGSVSDTKIDGIFNLSSISNLKNFNYQFKLPIENTSSNGDFYDLKINCSDIFGQETNITYLIDLNYNTNFMLIKPKAFVGEYSSFGYLSLNSQINFISDDNNLLSCNMSIDNQTSTNLNIISNDFTYQDHQFYKNITGNLNFAFDGLHNVSAICQDNSNNKIKKNYQFVVDTFGPSVHSFELIGNNISGVKSVVNVEGKSYTYSKNPGFLKVLVNSTGSGLKNNVNVSLISSTHFSFSSTILNLTSSIINLSSFEIHNFLSFINYYQGEKVDNKGLYYLNFSVGLEDRVGNKGNGSIGYFYDTSKLELLFSGDILGKYNGKLYTNVENPLFELNLNSPAYRTFSCNIFVRNNLESYTDNYKINFSNIANYSFYLNDIANGLKFKDGSKLNFKFDCTDIYGIKFNNSFDLKYDNIPPVLNDVSFDGGNEKFLKNSKNYNYNDLVDSLYFDLKDTNEDYVKCNYNFVSLSDEYSCNSSTNTVTFKKSDYTGVKDIVLLSGTTLNSNAKCVRTPSFLSKQNELISNNENFLTKIYVKSQCFDPSNFSTDKKVTDLNVNYVNGGLIDLKMDYSAGGAKPVVRSMQKYDKILISFVISNSNYLMQLTNVKKVNGVYVYTTNDNLDKNILTNDKLLYALGVDSTGKVIDSVFYRIFVDSEPPIVTFAIPEMDQNNQVFSDTFELDLNAIDYGVGVSKVELYEGSGIKIFSTDKTNSSFIFDNNSIITPDSSLNYFADGNFNGKLFYQGAKVGDNLNFKFKAYDDVGNFAEYNLNVIIKKGVGIKLLDSDNSKVDVSRMFLVTKTTAPKFKFETSQDVSFCSVYPFVDDAWVQVVGNRSDESLTSPNNNSNIFTFDLSSIPGYSLNNFSLYSAPIKIMCNWDGTDYINFRNIVYLDYLPDYVLNSTQGFILTNSPYETNLKVKSVGIYKSISCEYAIDDETYVPFKQTVGTSFTQPISFAQFNSGEHSLNLKCTDIAGNIGPEKFYNFLINKTGTLVIDNFNFSNLNNNYIIENNNLKIAPNTNVDLSFDANIKDGVGCQYTISSQGNIITNIINFFKGVLNIGVKNIPKNIGNEFKVNNLNFENKDSILKIICVGSSSDISKQFNVLIDNTSVSSTVNMVPLN